MAILEAAAVVLRQLRGPWIVGGDWNVEPQAIAAAGFPGLVDGVIFAPSAPTCHQSTYDFFLVSKGLAPAVAGVRRIDDGGFNPHFAARLYVRTDARRALIRELVRPTRVPGILPGGPQLHRQQQQQRRRPRQRQ